MLIKEKVLNVSRDSSNYRYVLFDSKQKWVTIGGRVGGGGGRGEREKLIEIID